MAALTPESVERIKSIANRYPDKRSGLLPALYVAQEQDGYVTDEAIEDISRILDVPAVDVKGVATFYTMYYHRPVGRHVFQVCGTLSCALCGAEEVIHHLEQKLGVGAGQTTPDGKFMFEVVECLGACGTAPVVLLGDKYYHNITLDEVDRLIDDLRAQDEPQPSPQLVGYREISGDKSAG